MVEISEIELNLAKDFSNILLWVKQKLFLLEYKKMSILIFLKKLLKILLTSY